MLNNITNKFKSNNEVKFIINKPKRITIVDNEIIELLPQIGADALAVMIYNLKFQNSKNHNISIKSLAKGTGISQGRIAKAIKVLIENGLMVREDIKENNLRTGYLYTIKNTVISSFGRNHGNTKNDLGNHENECTKKQNKRNKNNKKENSLLVNHNPKLDLILNSFKDNGLFLNKKIEKILKDNLDNFEEDLFIKIFENIANSRDKINNVLSYISRTFKILKDKGIKNLEEFLKDQETYFGSKKEIHKETTTKEIKKDNVIKKIHTRHHDIEQTYNKYSDKELEEMLLRNQKNKFKDEETDKEKELESLYKLAEENTNMLYNKSMFKKYWDIMTNDLKEKVINYAKEKNKSLAEHCIL